jgi:epoxyqueuosine reductase QueG
MQDSDGIEVKIRDFLSSKGIPVIGMSALPTLPGVPERFAPQALLREARSIICYGQPIPRGIVFADSNDLDLYWRYCNMVYRSLDAASNQLCFMLEQEGASAIPIYGCFPWKVVDSEFWGLLPLVYWAEQTGLGRLTKCGLLANPNYGTRILLGGVVTTLDLEPTGRLKGELCPADCFDCIDVCPVDAIEKTGKVNHNECIRLSTSNPLLAHLAKDRDTKQSFSFEALLNTVAIDDHARYLCFKCLKVCPLNNRSESLG